MESLDLSIPYEGCPGDIDPWAPAGSSALTHNGLHNAPLLGLVPVEELGCFSRMATMMLSVPAATLTFHWKLNFSSLYQAQ